MLSRSLFATSLVSLCLAGSVAAVGCSAPPDERGDDQAVVGSESEINAGKQVLVGKYHAHATQPREYGRLTLNANGTYEASVDVSDVADCATSRCLGPESGTWTAATSKHGTKLRLTPPNGAARSCEAQRTGTELTLTREGKTQTLSALAASACLDDSDCGASEECGEKVCLMWCEVGDPSCCGPSTCQPKQPAPCCDPSAKPSGGIEGVWCCGDGSWQYDIGSGNQTMSCSQNGGAGSVCGGAETCFGAWLDESGLCRNPADGVYPDACCADLTTPCGPSACGVGETCCNSLSGICTKPGEVCAF